MPKTPRLIMVNIRTTNKWDKVRELINVWLKDPMVYCNNCNSKYIKGIPCCESPQIMSNIQVATAVIKQVKQQKESLRNPFASNETNTMRQGLVLPPRLYYFLNQSFLNERGHKLFRNGEKGQKDMREFAKKFPQFSVMERV